MDKLDFRVGTLRDYLPDEAYRVACERAQRKVFADGETLHSRGDASPRLCIVADGAVRLGRFRPDGSFNLVTVLGTGGHFGDLGLQRAAYTHDESPRVYRRLHFLRGWSYEQANQIFPGVPGTGCPDRARSLRRV